MRISIRMLVFLLLWPATTTMAGVAVNHAKGVDFLQYRSFAWIDSEIESDLTVEKLLRTAVDRELEAKGLQKLKEAADLLVRAEVVVRQEDRDDVDILGREGRWSDSAIALGPSGEYVRQIGVGTVVVDLLDGHSRLQIWRGVATAVVRPGAGKKSAKRIDRAVDKLFGDFPPKGH